MIYWLSSTNVRFSRGACRAPRPDNRKPKEEIDMKKLFVSMVLALIAALGLTACTDEAAIAAAEAQRQQQAREAGAAESAAKTEARYVQAQAEMNKLAADTVRNGKFMSTANCNVKPDGFAVTSAVKTFPGKAFDFYRDACVKYVGHAVATAKAERERAVAAEKQRQQKLAAAKAKQEAKVAAQKACDQKHPPGVKRADCRAAVAKRYV